MHDKKLKPNHTEMVEYFALRSFVIYNFFSVILRMIRKIILKFLTINFDNIQSNLWRKL